MTVSVLKPVIPGDDYLLIFTFTNPDGTPENQNGAQLKVMVKTNLDDLDVDALSDVDVNAADPDASLGVIKATLPRAETKLYPNPVYVQAQRTLNGNKQSPMLQQLEVLVPVIKT